MMCRCLPDKYRSPGTPGLRCKLGQRVWGLFILLFIAGRAGHAWPAPPSDEGQPLMQSFTPRDYQADAACQAAVQDARGVLYVANNPCVLEYDGSTWRKVPVGGGDRIASLAYEAGTDRVFVGGSTSLGYLAANAGRRADLCLAIRPTACRRACHRANPRRLFDS